MNEAHVTVVGNVATPIDFKTTASGASVARFRLASTVRRYDKQQGSWKDAYTSFYTVWAWRSLAANVASSVTVGEPLIVTGQLRIRERESDERRYISAELTAVTIGHDLTRGTAAFVRVQAARAGLVTSPGGWGADLPPATPGPGQQAVTEAVVPEQPPPS
jgi:single-strand DNA-binding protein